MASAGDSFKALDLATLLRSNLSRYRIIADGLLPAALRKAQIDIWKQPLWAARFYRAGFTLQGGWK